MASAFHVKEHIVEAQHVREYPHATAHSQDEVLYLAVKQYIPKGNPDPQPGDVTIVAAHANGFVKEVYEPLWEDLVTELGKHNVKVRGIWMADVAWQGQSGVINERNLGNDPSWLDHARDLLHMVNHFRASMPRPLVGVGHSFGGNIVVNLALLHPRLLSSLVMVDPVLSHFHALGPGYGFSTMAASAFRRDLWPSRADAEAAFRRSRFYATWDPRALDAWCRHGVRDTPTALYPYPAKATLTTPKAMEIFTYYRPRLQGRDPATGARVLDRRLLPDAGDYIDRHPKFPFYRPEGPTTTEKLPALRPGVLWIFGEHSNVCTPDTRQEKMDLTGVGVGGSGGARASRVRQVVVEGFGHLVPLEATTLCARHAAGFVAEDLQHWRQEEAEFREWARRPDREKQTLDEDWKRWIGPPPRPVGKQKL